MANSITEVVNSIKALILQGQTEAAQKINNIQLLAYYRIGHCISANSREAFWGTSALETISKTLRAQLPGLRGFSVSSLKNMRLFYEEWKSIGTSFSPSVIGNWSRQNRQA